MIPLRKLSISIILFILLLNFPITHAQPSPVKNGAELQMQLNKLNVLGSVLYIAAHPDDENTSLIAYFAKELQMRTAYLSLTRGDGGQNLIGNETGNLLGVLRTQETMAARRIDGGEQFFTRAVDFGYSKTAEETLRNWDRELILSDIVKVIRQFRPDIIITRFSITDGGHGHHLASTILALEAFHAAADVNRFPEQLKELKPWQAKRIFWNTWRPTEKSLSLDVGGFNPYLGLSYSEIAAKSRSMHKCQGFGVSPNRGARIERFELLAGEPAENNLFDGIDYSWNRISDGGKIQELINRVKENFELSSPEIIVRDLVKIYGELEKLDEHYWIKIKKDEIKELIRQCSGLWMESIVNQQGSSRGKEIEINSMILNRSQTEIKLEKISTRFTRKDTLVNKTLTFNEPVNNIQKSFIPADANYSQPYWLEESGNGKMFTVNKNELIGKAENGSSIKTDFTLNIFGKSFVYETPVLYRRNDAREGEVYQPFIIRPEISLKILRPTYVFTKDKHHSVEVEIQAKEKNLHGKVFVELPEGWKSAPDFYDFSLTDVGDKKNISFEIIPLENAVNGEMFTFAEINGKIFKEEIIEINYPHIPVQTVLKPAKTNLVRLDINYSPGRIGYIMGSGDEIPELLRQLDYEVDLLLDDDLDVKDLSVYQTIICGVRAFNVRERLAAQQKKLNDFIYNGGTWIVQHNTRFGIEMPQVGPYDFTINGGTRIAEEDSPVKIINESHPLMNFPNKISADDFEGWVQERGLYFADKWNENLKPVLSGHDNGETPKEGGLLYGKYGKGIFIFSGYSWFRQLPEGVPGAYRIFINLISARGE